MSLLRRAADLIVPPPAAAAPMAERHPVVPDPPTPPRPDPLLYTGGGGDSPGMGPPWDGQWTVRPPSTLVTEIWAAHAADQARIVDPDGDDGPLVVPFIVPGEE